MSDRSIVLDRNLALEVVRVTEAAALSASRLMGRGDEKAADQAAVDAMRRALNSLSIEGVVVIGEGERDEAPMLYIGEKVGNGTGPRVDIALDPLEGTTHHRQGRAERARRHRHGRAGRLPQCSRRLHGQDRRRRRSAGRRGRHRRASRRKPEEPRQGQEDGYRGPGRLHSRPPAPCRSDRQGARVGRAHHADLRRRRVGRDRDLAARTAASTSTWARAAPRRACSPRRRCAASAARCRAS